MTAERLEAMHAERRLRLPPRSTARPDDGLSLREILSILRRRRRIVAIVAAAIVLAAAGYVALAAPTYTATAQILLGPHLQRSPVADTTSDPASAEAIAAMLESQVQIVGSHNVLLRAVAAAGLESDPQAQREGWTAWLRSRLGPQTASPESPELRALRLLRRAMVVRRADKTYILEISVRAGDPARAARLTNAVIDAYRAELASAAATADAQVAASLSAQLPALSAEVRRAELEVQQYRFQHNIAGVLDGPALAANPASLGLRELERNLDASRTVYNSYLLRARAAAGQARLERVEPRVISPAEPPLAPSWPRSGVLLGLGLFAGLGLGVGTGLFWDHFDARLWERREVEGAAGYPILAVIPRLTLTASGLAADSEGAFLRLRDMLHENVRGRTNKLVLITSGGAGEGKSTLAWNLAAAAAKDGERVFVISIGTEVGATTLPTGLRSDSVLEASSEQIRVWSVPEDAVGLTLFYRQVGRDCSPDALRALFLDLRRQVQAFDLVIVDCGAATDDRLLRGMAAIADEILLVACSGRTRAVDLDRALDALRPVEERIGGVILNRGCRG